MSVGWAVSGKNMEGSIISGEVGWNAEKRMSKKDNERPGSHYDVIKKKV